MKVGIIANPASGKDIRRLTANASVFDNQEKSSIVRRFLAGLEAVCPSAQISYFDDSHQIVKAALAKTSLSRCPIPIERSGTATDSTCAAQYFKSESVDVVLSLGGDGTNRVVVKGWQDLPLVALSTGTNNAFPDLMEATTVGYAIGLLLRHRLPIERVSTQCKLLRLILNRGKEDIALIDVVGTSDRFQGSRAIVDPEVFQFAVLSRADPMGVGVTSIGGLIDPIGHEVDQGLMIDFGKKGTASACRQVLAPIAPGVVRHVGYKCSRRIEFGRSVQFSGPVMIALDGEREYRLPPGDLVDVSVERSGPHKIDIQKVLRYIGTQV